MTVRAETLAAAERAMTSRSENLGELGNNISAGYITRFIDTIFGKFLVYAESFAQLYVEVLHMRDDINQWFGHH